MIRNYLPRPLLLLFNFSRAGEKVPADKTVVAGRDNCHDHDELYQDNCHDDDELYQDNGHDDDALYRDNGHDDDALYQDNGHDYQRKLE